MEGGKVSVWRARFVEAWLVGAADEWILRGGGKVVWEKLHALEAGGAFEQAREAFLRLGRVVHARNEGNARDERFAGILQPAEVGVDRFRIDAGPPLVGDRIRVLQVLENEVHAGDDLSVALGRCEA